MAQRVVMIADPSYTGGQTGVNAQLDTLNNANPISFLGLYDLTFQDTWAAIWAQSKGVPWVNKGPFFDACGYIDPGIRPLQHMLFGNPDRVLTIGTGAHVTSAVATATKRGHALTQG